MTEDELKAIEERANTPPSHGQEVWWIGDAHDDLLALTSEVRRLHAEGVCVCGAKMSMKCSGYCERDE